MSALIFFGIVSFSANAQSKKEKKLMEALKQIKNLTEENSIVAKNLETFQTLDFTVFSNRDWSRLHESHSRDIIVHFPDGHIEKGLSKHIETLDAMFQYAPDIKIKEQPLKLGKGNITAVMGFMEGTFTKPMTLTNGELLHPTGKKFRIPMATIGIWNDDGVMKEEYLFWDNQAFMNQISAK